MKRATFLHCSGIDAPRLNVLRQRGHLAFFMHESDNVAKWAEYTLDQAFRLRLQLDLIGGDGGDEAHLGGIGPGYAAQVVSNAMGYFPRHPLNQIEPFDWWAGLVVFEDNDESNGTFRFSKWYVGELEQLGAWVEHERKVPCDGAQGTRISRRLQVVRVFLANATRAANFVRDRASELGLEEGADFSEVKP